MDSSKSENDEINLLLPWFVNGTLGAQECAIVVEHLVVCAKCRNAEAEFRRISAAIKDEQPTPLVPGASIDDFLKGVFDRKTAPQGSLRIHWVAVAASIAGLVAISAWFLMPAPQSNVFRTATTGPSRADISYVFDLVVDADSHQSVRQAVSETYHGGSIMASESGYRVSVSMPSATMKELEVFADSLREIDGVQHVEVIGVQLPFE